MYPQDLRIVYRKSLESDVRKTRGSGIRGVRLEIAE
jgi:hypothetical protein